MNSTRLVPFEVDKSIKVSPDAIVLIRLIIGLQGQMSRFKACRMGVFSDSLAFEIYSEVRNEVARLCDCAQDDLSTRYGLEPGIQYHVQKPIPGESYYTMTPV